MQGALKERKEESKFNTMHAYLQTLQEPSMKHSLCCLTSPSSPHVQYQSHISLNWCLGLSTAYYKYKNISHKIQSVFNVLSKSSYYIWGFKSYASYTYKPRCHKPLTWEVLNLYERWVSVWHYVNMQLLQHTVMTNS